MSSDLQRLSDAAGFITSKNEYGHPDLRAGNLDRSAAHKALADAKVAGRLTQEQLDARSEMITHAQTQAELRMLVRDLPLPPPAEDPIEKVSRIAKATHKRHPHLTHAGGLLAIINAIIFSWIGPSVANTGIYGENGNSPWIVLPILVTIFGVIAVAVTIAFWVDCDDIDGQARRARSRRSPHPI